MPTERRQRRLVLYIFGSTLLILIFHAAFTTSPVGDPSQASHYGRYTGSVVAWREKGIAAMNGAVDGWKQAGAGFNQLGGDEEAQEYLESLIPESGPEGLEQGQQGEGEGPVVEEVEEGEAHRVPEQTYDWPAAWPEEDKGEPTQEQIMKEEKEQEVQLGEQQESVQEHQEEGQDSDQAEGQNDAEDQGEEGEDEHREDDTEDPGREGELREGDIQDEQIHQEKTHEEDNKEEDGQEEEHHEEENHEGDRHEEGEQGGEDHSDDDRNGHNDQEEHRQDNVGDHHEDHSGDGEAQPESQAEGEHHEEEPHEPIEESQKAEFAWPDHSEELQKQQENQDNHDDEDDFFPSLQPAPPSAPEPSSDSESNTESEPKEPPSTETFPFSIALPEHLRLHHPGDQPRVVILQHVFPSDTVSRKLFSLSEAAYRAYAQHWGYKYVRDDGVYMPNEYEARRKGMNKLYPVLRVMIEELGKADGAEWMLMTDADTVPINPSIPLHTLIPPSSHVWFMGNEDWNGFNAGNMLLRISRETVAFMSHVISREVDMSRYENTGKYTSAPPSDQEALCLSISEPEWQDHFYRIPMKWINAYSSPYEKGQDEGGPITLPWTDGGEQQPGVWTPQVNFHLVFILKHYRETDQLQEQIERVWRKMADEQEWAGDVKAKTEFAASIWWDQFKDGDRWKKGGSPKCMGF